MSLENAISNISGELESISKEINQNNKNLIYITKINIIKKDILMFFVITSLFFIVGMIVSGFVFENNILSILILSIILLIILKSIKKIDNCNINLKNEIEKSKEILKTQSELEKRLQDLKAINHR